MDDLTNAAVRQALLTWKEAGYAKPAIPLHSDVDGDGKIDYLYLGEDDNAYITGDPTGLDLIPQSDESGFETGVDNG